MFKKTLSLFVILISLTGCKAEDFKDKIIGFTDKNESLKQPPYVWYDFKNQGIITERKIQIEGEAANPMVVQDGIIYIDRRSGTDELFLFNTDRNTITQLTSRKQSGKKSPIYALRVYRDVSRNGSTFWKRFAWIEKGNTENSWEIYYGFTNEDQSFEAKKIHDFIIPSSDIAKINEYVESLQINSEYLIWAEPTKNMSLVNVYTYEHSNYDHKKRLLTKPNSTEFTISNDWIIFRYKHPNPSYHHATFLYVQDFLTDYSHSWTGGTPMDSFFMRENLVAWQDDYNQDVHFTDLVTTTYGGAILLSFDNSRNDVIALAGAQDDILYFRGRRTVYAVDLLTLKRARISPPENRLNNINYYKNRFVTSQTNGHHTDLYLYEVSF